VEMQARDEKITTNNINWPYSYSARCSAHEHYQHKELISLPRPHVAICGPATNPRVIKLLRTAVLLHTLIFIQNKQIFYMFHSPSMIWTYKTLKYFM
jgi:hypothetical protein